MHDVGKPATRRFEPGGAVSFRHHDMVGSKLTDKRMKALRFDNDTIKAVARLVELHMRFYGYGEAGWSDSAVRRYVTDAGPLLERLHRLTRSDVPPATSARRTGCPSPTTTWRSGSRRCASRNPSKPSALTWTAARSWPCWTQARPVVGRAYKFLLEERMEHGPLDPAAAESGCGRGGRPSPRRRPPASNFPLPRSPK